MSGGSGQRVGKVGHPADGDDRNLAGVLADGVDNELSCFLFFRDQQVGFIRDIDIAQPVLAMNPRRPRLRRPISVEGNACATDDGSIDFESHLQEKGVSRRLLDRSISEHRRDPDKVDIGVAMQEEQSHRVIHARVRIENHLRHWQYPPTQPTLPLPDVPRLSKAILDASIGVSET